jgi:hypothetical protein
VLKPETTKAIRRVFDAAKEAQQALANDPARHEVDQFGVFCGINSAEVIVSVKTDLVAEDAIERAKA